mgnify:FL=1
MSKTCGRRQDASRPSTDAGFTLIELLVAFGLLTALSVAAVTLLLNAMQTVTENSDRVYAANLARNAIQSAQLAGADALTIGKVSTAVTSPEGRAFTVATTSNWVGLNQQSSACDAVTPGRAYMRVHVEVSGGTLGRTETSDTLVAPAENSSLITTGSLAIKVVDERAQPVSDVTLSLVDLATSQVLGPFLTGPDGCVFATRLAPSANWRVTIARAGYVPHATNGTVATTAVVANQTSRLDFEYAAAARLRFESAAESFPIPDGMPLSMGPDPMTITRVAVPSYPTVVSGLWPAITGYQAWMGICNDADPSTATAPRTSSVNRTWYVVSPGTETTAPLTGVATTIRGLPARTTVTAKHAKESSGACTTAVSYPIGTTDELGRLNVMLPYGSWTLSAPGTADLAITLDPASPSALVSFPVASLDLACLPATGPAPTPTPASTATPLATFGVASPPPPCPVATGTPTPTPSVTP